MGMLMPRNRFAYGHWMSNPWKSTQAFKLGFLLKLVGHPCPTHSGFDRMEMDAVDLGGFIPHLAGGGAIKVPAFH
jgi:hypothetical protein